MGTGTVFGIRYRGNISHLPQEYIQDKLNLKMEIKKNRDLSSVILQSHIARAVRGQLTEVLWVEENWRNRL